MDVNTVRVWIQATRPKTLPASITPVLIGSALAYDKGAICWPPAIAAGLGAILIQIGTNFANDYFDFVKGADTSERVGPTRATQAGLVAPAAMRWAMMLTFALALVPGAYIVYRGGVPFLIIGIAAIASGILYTAGPIPLGYLGLGDVFVLVFLGPIAVAGTYYLQVLEFDWLPVIAGASPGLFSVAILTVNNIRDIDGDCRAGKKTLAVRFGADFAKVEYIVALASAGFFIPLYLCVRTGEHYYSLFGAIALLPALFTIRAVLRRTDGPALNRALASTGGMLVAFSVIFSLGWVIS